MAEDNCNGIFPTCPACGKGALLPFSYKEDVFEKWKCSECKHTIMKRE
jgi:hypothetical protein